jgi:hypothetical protein
MARIKNNKFLFHFRHNTYLITKRDHKNIIHVCSASKAHKMIKCVFEVKLFCSMSFWKTKNDDCGNYDSFELFIFSLVEFGMSLMGVH